MPMRMRISVRLPPVGVNSHASSILGQGQGLSVKGRLDLDRNRRPKRLRRVAGAFRMSDQAFDLWFRSRALELQIERHLLKGAGRPAKVVLIRDAERGTNVGLSLFDRHFVERRKLRQLGEQSKGRAGEEILQRRRGEVVAPALRRLV